MTQVGRAREKGETDGFMKILVDAETTKILGASLLGIDCDEVIHFALETHVQEIAFAIRDFLKKLRRTEPKNLVFTALRHR